MLGLKEGLVECATVCVKIVVILGVHYVRNYIIKMNRGILMQMLVNGTIMTKMETICVLMGLKENIQSPPKSYSSN